jgi:synaptobrevin homolog YKT6
MRLFSLAVLRNDVQPAVLLASAQDLSTFGFFQRSTVGEFMNFFSKTVAERTQAGQRQDVEENSTFLCPPQDNNLDYVGHVYSRTEGVVGVVISDKDYPLRVAYSLLSKILDEFLQRYPASKFKSATSLDFPELHSVRVPSGVVIDDTYLVFDTIPRSKSGRYDHESSSRIGRDENCAS